MTSLGSLAAVILSPQVVLSFGVLATIGFLTRKRTARALGTSAKKAFWALAAIAAIVSVTLLGRHFEGMASTFWLFDASLWRSILVSQLSNFVLNLVLFVPAGVALAAATRRPLLAFFALTALSFAIECIQQATGFGAPDPADWVANTIGGLVGALIAWPAVARSKH